MQKPNDLSFYKQWLNLADEDLHVVKKVLGDDMCMHVAIFHTQQCAEKALKAFLLCNKQVAVKRHDLMQIVRQCAQFDPLFNVLLRRLERLNPFQSRTRYPDEDFIIVTLNMLKASIDDAEYVLHFVKERIG